MLAFSFADDQRLCEEDRGDGVKKNSRLTTATPRRHWLRNPPAACPGAAKRCAHVLGALRGVTIVQRDYFPLSLTGILALYCAPAVSGLHTYQIINFPSFGHAAKHLPT